MKKMCLYSTYIINQNWKTIFIMTSTSKTPEKTTAHVCTQFNTLHNRELTRNKHLDNEWYMVLASALLLLLAA